MSTCFAPQAPHGSQGQPPAGSSPCPPGALCGLQSWLPPGALGGYVTRSVFPTLFRAWAPIQRFCFQIHVILEHEDPSQPCRERGLTSCWPGCTLEAPAPGLGGGRVATRTLYWPKGLTA